MCPEFRLQNSNEKSPDYKVVIGLFEIEHQNSKMKYYANYIKCEGLKANKHSINFKLFVAILFIYFKHRWRCSHCNILKLKHRLFPIEEWLI